MYKNIHSKNTTMREFSVVKIAFAKGLLLDIQLVWT